MKRCLCLIGLVVMLWTTIFIQWKMYYDESIILGMTIEKIEIVHDELNQRIDCSDDEEMIKLIQEIKLMSYDGQQQSQKNDWYISINDGEIVVKSSDDICYSKINYRVKNLDVFETLVNHMNQCVVQK